MDMLNGPNVSKFKKKLKTRWRDEITENKFNVTFVT